MSGPNKPTVYVTDNGGFRIEVKELMASKKAKEIVKNMSKIRMHDKHLLEHHFDVECEDCTSAFKVHHGEHYPLMFCPFCGSERIQQIDEEVLEEQPWATMDDDIEEEINDEEW